MAGLDRNETGRVGLGAAQPESVVDLELTERGHEVVEAVWRGTEAIDEQLATRVSQEEIEAMRAGLIALADIKAETAALAHYATLGFQTFAYECGDGYGFANRDGLSIHLALEPGHDPASTYLSVRDADASSKSGASRVSVVSPAPWA